MSLNMLVPDYVKAIFANYPEYKFVKGEYGPEIEYEDGLWPITTPLDIELGCYRQNWNGNAYQHLKKAHDILWPQDIKTWNYWTERRFRAHCEGHKFITWAGGANIGKSVDAAKIVICHELASPSEHAALVGSTTLKASESRMWGYVKQYYLEFASTELPGKLTANPGRITFRKSDTIHGIFSVPLIQANTSRSHSDLIGRHPKERLLVVIDEGPDVPPGFMEAESNWEKTAWFQCIVIGNSAKMTDPHGILSAPLAGWDKIDPDRDSEWITKKGICLYFDCYQSPAIHETDPEKKKALSKFLFTEEKIQASIETYGENSAHHWRMCRGFWAPSDISKTVLSLVDIDKHKAREHAHWLGKTENITIAGLDASFTADGDDCVLRFATLGEDIEGNTILDLGDPKKDLIHIRFDVTSDEPPEYQLVEKAKLECIKRGVDPYYFVTDLTGNNIGAIFKKEWSPAFLGVDSRMSASEELVDPSNPDIRCKDLYDRRATELIFMLQRFVRAGQIRGLDAKTIEQITTREWEWKGKKMFIEQKKDYKMRMGRVDSRYKSPDEMDCACLLIELARKRFNFTVQTKKLRTVKSGLRKFLDYNNQMGGAPAEEIVGAEFGDNFETPSSSRFSHPNSWNDSFLHGEEYEEESER